MLWWAVTTLTWAAEVHSLRCEYRSDPLGVDTCAPRLSWIIASDRRDEVQTACYARPTAVKLWHRGDKLPHVMTLAEIDVLSGGKNVAFKKSVTASSSVEGYG